MTKQTADFIEALFEGYQESSSGKEEENAQALKSAWDELEQIKKGAVSLIENPETIVPCKLDCIAMPNGEVISLGKTVGRVKNFKGALTIK